MPLVNEVRVQVLKATHGSGLRVPRVGIVCVLTCVIAVAFAGRSVAAPISYYDVPGTGDQPIANLIAADDGTLWMAQRLSYGSGSDERHMRLLHVDGAGDLIAASPEIEGDPTFTEMVASSDGGAWVLPSGDPLRHVSPAGALEEISVPTSFRVSDLAAGTDGRVWARACKRTVADEAHEEECDVLAASPDGTTELFSAPDLEADWPLGAKSMRSATWAVSTGGGTWFTRLYLFDDETTWTRKTVFVSHTGTVSPVILPPESYVSEGAPGEAAWWLRDDGTAGAVIGKVDKTGTTSNTQHLDNVSDYDPPDGYSTAPGRNGDLVWAQNATWSDTFDGQLGVRRLDGGSSIFQLPRHALSVLVEPEANFWSGSCVLGSRLHEAVDGSLWTLSFGHPSRVTRQQLSGEFSVFLVGDPGSRDEEEEIGTYALDGLVETDSRSLWFTRNLPTGPQLARLDPLDPPPAEPPYPGARAPVDSVEHGGGVAAAGQAYRLRVRQLLRSVVRQSRRGLARQRRFLVRRNLARKRATERRSQKSQSSAVQSKRSNAGKRYTRIGRFRVRGHFPLRGRVTVKLRWRHKGKRRPLMLAVGRKHAPAGMRVFNVRLRRSGRVLMRSGRHLRPVLVVKFHATGQVPVRRAVRLRFGRRHPSARGGTSH